MDQLRGLEGMNQLDLVDRAAHGDRAAFAELATQHIDRCFALAVRILRDRDRAQDATQQALLGAWRDLPTLREPERFDAWLHRLVVHACYTEARGTRRWNTRVRLLPSANDPVPDPAHAVVDRAGLEDAFAQLTPEQRAVVVLHHHHGYSLTELAGILGIPVGTARSRLFYAVRQLRTVLDGDLETAVAPGERSA
jgi:RNA polymerase sigma-70 factor (ECF subfamily)